MFVGRSNALATANRVIAEQKEANAAIVEFAYREKRADSVKYARMVADAVNQKRKAELRLDGQLTMTGMQLDSARAVLADSSASTVALRYSLTMTVAKIDSLVSSIQVYRHSTDRVIAAQDSVIRWQAGALVLADSTIALKNQSIALWRKAAECRIVFGVRCPTRTTAFVGGAIVTLGVIIAVR